jgi:hypothetical protein
MSAKKFKVGTRQESEIDFRQFFSPPTENIAPSQDHSPASPLELWRQPSHPRAKSKTKIGWPAGTNIGFAAVTFIGGLFCAFYFFESTEPFRVSARWPRELMDQRPFALKHHLTMDMVDPAYSQLSHKESFDRSIAQSESTDPAGVRLPQLEPSRREDRNAFPPSTGFQPGLLSPRSSQTSPSAGGAPSAPNRVSTNANSAETSASAKRKTAATEGRKARSLRNNKASPNKVAQHTLIRLNRLTHNDPHSARFDNAKRSVNSANSAPHFNPRTPETFQSLNRGPSPSSHMAPSLSPVSR